jgi:hypothetical protein
VETKAVGLILSVNQELDVFPNAAKREAGQSCGLLFGEFLKENLCFFFCQGPHSIRREHAKKRKLPMTWKYPFTWSSWRI